MGHIISLIRETYPGKPQWSIDAIPDLTGKVMVVTGANAGIGKATAKVLLEKNATVYITCRSQTKADQAVKELKEQTGGKEARVLLLDLGNLKSVKKAAEEFLTKEPELHVLFNNAGVMYPPVDMLTDDGYDLQFGTNVIGHFAFTKFLLPALIAGGRSTHGPARVVNSSSIGHRMFKPDVDFNTLKDSPARVKKGTTELYSQSKFGNVLVSNEIARRYVDQNIISMSLNPGYIATDLARHVGFTSVNSLLAFPPATGALSQLRAGTTPEALEWNGKYLVPWARLGPPHKNTENLELSKQLWEYLEEQIKDV